MTCKNSHLYQAKPAPRDWFASGATRAGSQLKKSEDDELIIGNTSLFAIESNITKAYERLSFRGLGSFVIHVGGRSYARSSADGTLLACSFDEVERRIEMHGTHNVSFAAKPDAGKIA